MRPVACPPFSLSVPDQDGGHGAKSAPLPTVRVLDCFVARAPRNDGLYRFAQNVSTLKAEIDYCPAASAPRVRGSAAPNTPFGVTAIVLAEVWPSGTTITWPIAFSAASVSSAKPRSTRTSSGSHW